MTTSSAPSALTTLCPHPDSFHKTTELYAMRFDSNDGGEGNDTDDDERQTMQVLLFGLSLIRVLLPALALGLLVTEVIAAGLRRLFAKLQRSSFLETGSGYQRIVDRADQQQRPTTTTNTNNARSSVVLPPDENGILPISVRVRSVRRGLVYALLSLTVLAYVCDGGVLVAHSITDMQWESHGPDGARLWAFEEFYLVGCSVAVAARTLVMAFEERSEGLGKFRLAYPILTLCTLLAGESALLGVLARVIQLDAKRIHVSAAAAAQLSPFGGDLPPPTSPTTLPWWTIAHISLLAFRILALLLATLSLTPLLARTDYARNEYSSLLPGEAVQATTNTPSASYGTFGNGNGSGGVPGSGSATPKTIGAQNGSANGEAPKAPIPEYKQSFWARIRILSPYLWPKKSRTLQCVALFCFVLLGVGRVVNLFVPRTLGHLVEDLNVGRSPWRDLLLYAFLRFMQGSGGLTQVLQSNLWIPVAQYSEREMSQMTFTHLLNLSLSFQVRKKTGEVLRTLDRGSAINSFFQVILFQFLPIAVDIVVAIGYLWFTFGLTLASLVFVIMVVYVILSVVLTRLRVKLRRDMNDKDKYTRGIHADALANWETIKYFTAEERELERYAAALKDYQRAEFRVIASLNFLNLTQNAIISVGLLVGSLIVAFSVVQGERSVGEFVMFLTYLTQLYGPLNVLGTLYRMIQTNLTDTDNLMKLLAEEKEIVDKPGAIELGKAKGGIDFDHVSFSYDGKVTALKDINVKIAPGTSVALVGESGAGKSTLLRLLYRFYDVTGGAIRFDGTDIRDVTQTSLRKAIGVVPQEAVLFNESIAYNISYGKEGSTQAEVEEAAKAARIYDRIIGFPDAWDTKVGERGVRLSGGEKQRVSIARTILKNPAILLLDEATSALDTATERSIQSSLRTLAEGRTSIAIAHRLSTITYSDLILVMSDGAIAEQGDHKTLLAKKGLYYGLWNKQIRAEEEGTEFAPPDADAAAGTAVETDGKLLQQQQQQRQNALAAEEGDADAARSGAPTPSAPNGDGEDLPSAAAGHQHP